MFFDSDVTVIRKDAGNYNDDGVFVNGTAQTMTIRANVQPLGNRGREQYTHILEGGNRTAQLVRVYTNAVLYPDSQTTGQAADVVLWRGRAFKIIMAEEWQSNIISHFKYIGQEIVANDNG